jgi:hypothetical protein
MHNQRARGGANPVSSAERRLQRGAGTESSGSSALGSQTRNRLSDAARASYSTYHGGAALPLPVRRCPKIRLITSVLECQDQRRSAGTALPVRRPPDRRERGAAAPPLAGGSVYTLARVTLTRPRDRRSDVRPQPMQKSADKILPELSSGHALLPVTDRVSACRRAPSDADDRLRRATIRPPDHPGDRRSAGPPARPGRPIRRGLGVGRPRRREVIRSSPAAPLTTTAGRLVDRASRELIQVNAALDLLRDRRYGLCDCGAYRLPRLRSCPRPAMRPCQERMEPTRPRNQRSLVTTESSDGRDRPAGRSVSLLIGPDPAPGPSLHPGTGQRLPGGRRHGMGRQVLRAGSPTRPPGRRTGSWPRRVSGSCAGPPRPPAPRWDGSFPGTRPVSQS